MKHHKPLLESCHGSNPLIETNLYTNSEIKLEDMKIINRRFMGAGMSQSYAAIYWQEYYYEANRFEYVVEFGSQKGSLSTYFANMAAITEAFFFDTFEFYPQTDWYSRPNEGAGHWFSKLADNSPFINYFHQDVFDESSVNRVKENIDQFKTFIFCDGGDKVSEFLLYSPLLKKGDCIAVHDWNHEIGAIHTAPICEKYGLEPHEPYASSAMNLQTQIMPFIKK
jgi:cephalosporin hydroxylase